MRQLHVNCLSCSTKRAFCILSTCRTVTSELTKCRAAAGGASGSLVPVESHSGVLSVPICCTFTLRREMTRRVNNCKNP